MTDDPISCAVCGQDRLAAYRNVFDGQEFLLCPECDALWLPGDDTSKWTDRDLDDVFAGRQFLPGKTAWDYIEPVESASP